MRLAGGRRPEIPDDDVGHILDRSCDRERYADAVPCWCACGKPPSRHDGVPEGEAFVAGRYFRCVNTDAQLDTGESLFGRNARLRAKPGFDRFHRSIERADDPVDGDWLRVASARSQDFDD